MRRAVFLDRDGVLNQVVWRDARPMSPRTLEEFVLIEGAAAQLARLKAAGYQLVVVTNQPDLARGAMTWTALEAMTHELRAHLPVDDVRVCPHDNTDHCACRKPLPGMLQDAAVACSIDLRRSYLIGDSWKDMAAARAAGCTGILLDAPYNQQADSDIRVANLEEAINFVLDGIADYADFTD